MRRFEVTSIALPAHSLVSVVADIRVYTHAFAVKIDPLNCAGGESRLSSGNRRVLS